MNGWYLNFSITTDEAYPRKADTSTMITNFTKHPATETKSLPRSCDFGFSDLGTSQTRSAPESTQENLEVASTLFDLQAACLLLDWRRYDDREETIDDA